jgi:hypothetical protein
MADRAFLNTSLLCPNCGREVADQAWFQWGFCSGQSPRPETTYEVGDAIRWRSCRDGHVPGWTAFSSPNEIGSSNLGTPAITDLFVCDDYQTWLIGPCPHCAVELGGAALEIREGRIFRGFLRSVGALASSSIWLITSEGLKPMPEWENHRLEVVNPDC